MKIEKTLVDILKENQWDCDKDPNCGNKIFPAHTYLEVYDRLFHVFKEKKINVLEIGILRGISLKLWANYFTEATIYGADTFERGGDPNWPGCKQEDVRENLKDFGQKIKLVKVNSTSNNSQDVLEREEFLNSIPDGFFHIIIDDGSHELIDQKYTFENFKSKLNKDGIYIVEDIGITNSEPFDPKKLIDLCPELKLIDMRYPEKHDNAIAIYYDNDCLNFNHFENYYLSDHWKIAHEFTTDYIYNKQKES